MRLRQAAFPPPHTPSVRPARPCCTAAADADRRPPHAQGGASRPPGATAAAGVGEGREWGVGGCGDGDWSGRSAATTQSSASLYFYVRPLSADLAASARPESLRACGGWSLSAGREARRGRSQRDMGRGDPPAADVWIAAAAATPPATAATAAAKQETEERSRCEVQFRL